jgi:aminoglycoside phosphotransferase family enzyme
LSIWTAGNTINTASAVVITFRFRSFKHQHPQVNVVFSDMSTLDTRCIHPIAQDEINRKAILYDAIYDNNTTSATRTLE